MNTRDIVTSESRLWAGLSALARRAAAGSDGAVDAALRFIVDTIGCDGALFAGWDGSAFTVESLAGDDCGLSRGQRWLPDQNRLTTIIAGQSLALRDESADQNQTPPGEVAACDVRNGLCQLVTSAQNERFGLLCGIDHLPRAATTPEVAALEVASLMLANTLSCTRNLTLIAQQRTSLANIVDLSLDAIITIDQTRSISQFNPAAERIFGWSANQIFGHPVEALMPERSRESHRTHVGDFSRSSKPNRLMRPRSPLVGLRANGDEFPIEASVLQAGADDNWHATIILRDISDRRIAEDAAARANQQYRSLFDDAPVMYIVTHRRGSDIVITDCNDLFLQTCGYTREQVTNNLLINIFAPDCRSDVLSRYEQTQTAENTEVERQLLTSDGRLIDVLIQTRPEVAIDGVVEGTRAALIDITARKAAAQLVLDRAKQQSAIANLGQLAMTTKDTTELLDQAVRIVAETLDVEFAKVLELLHGDNELLLKAGVGWRSGLVGIAKVGVGTDSQAGYTLLTDDPVIVEDLRTDPRFNGPELLRQHGITSGLSVVIRGHDRTFGVLGAHTSHHRTFSAADVDFLISAANTLAIALERDQAVQALSAAERKYRTLVEQMPAVIYTQALGAPNATLYANAHTERLLGYSPAEWQANPGLWCTRVSPDDRDRLLDADRLAIDHGLPYREEYRMIARDGSVVWVEDGAALILDDDGNPSHWQGIVVDITARRESETRVREAEAEFRMLFMNNPHPVWVCDLETLRFMVVNDAAVDVYGYSRDEFMDLTLADLRPPEDIPELLRAVAAHNPKTSAGQIRQTRHRAKNGRIYDVEINIQNCMFRGRAAMLAIVHDVTERLALEAQLSRQAFYDPLTGLPNRTLFLDRLSHAREITHRGSHAIAVLFLDIDDFKIVNDTLGHESGDLLLSAVANRLKAIMRGGDSVSRFGGDEFTILLEDLDDPLEAQAVAARVAENLRLPITIAGREIFVHVSIGIAIAGINDGDEELLRRADTAMYAAKRRGKACFAVFDEQMDVSAWLQLRLRSELQRALEREEFVLHYQPIVDLASGRVVSLEALIRWRHPTMGLVSPNDFLPVAEGTGLIVPIGEWVVEEACRHAAAWFPAWATTDDQSPRINVNLASRQLSDPMLVNAIARILNRSGLSPDTLRLEVTERTLVEELRANRETLRELSAIGVRLAVDDFGAGASSLAILQEFDADVLKLDRMFAQNLTTNRRNRAVIHAVTTLAHELGMRVTIEGIETVEQLEIARELRCDNVQGYLVSRPVAAAGVPQLLRPGTFEAIAQGTREQRELRSAVSTLALSSHVH